MNLKSTVRSNDSRLRFCVRNLLRLTFAPETTISMPYWRRHDATFSTPMKQCGEKR